MVKMADYDVLVVGAGPVGSTFARHMAEKGYDVAILEKKREIGVPLQCAGLLGKKIKKVNVLPEEYILNQVSGAYIHSPSNHILKVSKKETHAYVLDRIGYDKFLAELAVNNGADILLKHKVADVNAESGKVKLVHGEKELSADIIVGADGSNSIISPTFNSQSKSVHAVQYLVETNVKLLETDFVDLHVNSNISPGFIWSIPLSNSQARIGLFGNYDYPTLNKFLTDFMNSNEKFKDARIIKKYYGTIPVSDSRKNIVNNRVLLVGDAASQVKPTTGGGLIIGFECAKIAAEAASNAIENDNISLLADYELNYRKKFEKELKIQLGVQKTFELLSDADLDEMFLKLKEKGAEDIISNYGDMDKQSHLVKEMIKRGMLMAVLPKVMYRSVSNIWNFF
jgi:digeranylgeranylglycerophospholipid reductase